MRVFIRLLQYIRPNIKYLVIALFFSCLEIISHLGLPYVLKTLIDEVLIKKNPQIFFRVVSGYFLLTLAIVIFGLVKDYLYTLINEKTVKESRVLLYNHLRQISIEHFQRYKVGQLMSYFINDIPKMVGRFPSALIDLIRNLLRLMVSIVILVYIDYKILLLLLTLLPFYLLNATLFIKHIRDSTEELQEQQSNTTASLQEHISATNEILAFNQKKWDINKIKNIFLQRIKLTIKNTMWINTANQTSFLIYWIAITVVYFVGGRNVLNGTMTIGTVFFYEKYIDNIYMPARLLIANNNNIQSYLAVGKRYFNFIDSTQNKAASTGNKISISKMEQKITFEKIFFKYAEDYILKDISFAIPKGSKTAIMGESGSGKSTLIKLLLNFYQVNQGKILIDNYNINDLKSKNLYGLISVVFQEPFLFSDTISNNIRFGYPQATEEEVITAAKLSAAHDFIIAMKNGYETVLSEKGASLSGGQKQRIAIARAIIKPTDIIVFDEAVSSLDEVTKNKVLSNIYNMDKTVIYITHNLKDIKNTDQIIVLDKGQISYIGSYNSLLIYNKNF